MMKRVFAVIMVLAILFGMSATAFAAEPQGTGSITITNATIDSTYTIYKIFDATYSEADGTKAVSYTVEKNTPAYDAVTSTEGQKYFSYSAETGVVSKKEGVNDSELIAYLTGLVTDEHSEFEPVQAAVKATDDTVVFTGLDYGYYLITSDLGAAVTITSNTPDVTVIDKNQKPGDGFDKVIVLSDGEEVDKNTSAIGDKVDYKITVGATNYDGDKHIRYYQILDTLGASLAADLSTFRVTVGGVALEKGWLLNNTTSTGAVNEGKIGTWDGEMNDAQWYLVYLGNNQFRVTIPWQTNHVISGTTGAYKIEFNGTDHQSKYDSPTEITLTYSVYVKSDAPIGGGTHDALTNTANASWTSANETDTTPTKTVLTEVFGLGVLKDDGTTGKNLAGAKFRIWADSACTSPVYIIPTNIEGVYILDSLNSAAAATGTSDTKLSRAVYAEYLDAYLGENAQDNYAVTPVNGKIVILGLDAGTYYLQEVQAPDGYNALTAPVEIKAGEGQTPFYVFADANGKVADLRDPDATHSRNTYNVTHTSVHNSKGIELPSTGGEGAVMLITFGSIIAVAFAVLLITQKKMSIYRD